MRRWPHRFVCVAIAAMLILFFNLHASAQDDPGWLLYQKGDYAGAAQRFLTDAKAGKRLAQFNYAMMLLRGETSGSTDQALSWLRKSADLGLAQAQYNLGLLYENGKIGPLSQTEATRWFRHAAEQGHTDAAVSLATQYFLGRGAPKNESEAARWYESAAEDGDVGSQYIIASCYERGYGVAINLPRALLWYIAAARQGDAVASAKAQALAKQVREAQRDGAVKR